MQDTIDSERVISLGAPPDRVKVTGNMKFDAEVPANVEAPDVVRRFLGLNENDPLLVAGSTHEGEEETIVEAFKELILEFPTLKLLIAPRHIDRVEKVERVISKSGLTPVRVSRLNDTRFTINDKRILILDSIGHLNEAYSAATLVFVGGSLVKHGGQNPVEPAVLGKAMLFGPHMFNFRYITKVLLKEGAALQITGKEDLVKKLKTLLMNPLKRSELGDNAKRAIAQNRGATKKNLEKISEILR